MTHTTIQSPIGELTLVARDGRLAGLYFPHHWPRPDRASFGPRAGTGLEAAASQLEEYFAGQRTTFSLNLDPRGDAFQARVWDRLTAIPYGHTVTYGDLARDLGGEVTAKDVGVAVGHNPLSVIIPCHRVVGKDGSLTGYAGGLARKRFLLDLEEASARLF